MPKHPSKGTYDVAVNPKVENPGRGAVKKNSVKATLANRPGKLQQTETGKHKKSFTP